MTTATAPAPTGTQTVPTIGFELHFTGIGRNGEDSDKFWRVLCAGGTQIVHNGRRGAAGLVHVKRFGSAHEARTASIKLADEKSRQTGYGISRNMVKFDLPSDVVAKAGSSQIKKNLPGQSEVYSRQAVSVFLSSSALIGV